nr:MAG TPA: hypothetical protein [Caudoviricetes sp.]
MEKVDRIRLVYSLFWLFSPRFFFTLRGLCD